MCLMKNLIKSMTLLAVAAMGLSACNEQNLTPEQVGKGELVTVHFGANSSIEPATKATLTTEDEKTFKSAWENGDVLSVEYYNGGTANTTGKVEAKWVDATSSFDTSLPEYTGTWTYDAVYPAPNAEGEVDFGSARVQNGNLYNSKYDLMFGEATAENAPAGKTDDGKDVVFNMDRQTGIVYFHLTSALDEEVVSATLSVSEVSDAIASSLVMPNKEYSKGFDISIADLKDITITFEEGTAPKAKDFQLWFNVLPAEYDEMTLHVETTGHTLDMKRTVNGSDYFVAGKLYKTVATVPNAKWVAKAAEIPVYASLADLVAAGAPTTDGAQVTVTLTDEVIKTFNGTKGINILVGEQAIQLYCKSTAFPTDWTEGGTLSGTLSNCEWVLYGGNTWELCPSNWDELTYKAPESPIEIPVYASLAELIAAGAPTTAGEQVTVTLTDEEITGLAKSGKYTNGVFLKVGDQEIEIYCYDVPSTWEVGGKISGTLTDCKWVLYVDRSKNETWELCPNSWDVFTYTAPLPTCATPVIDIDKTTGAATIACETTGATIHYTVGESPADPTENDAVYSSAVTLTDGQTIKAIAIADGYKPSAIASKKYVVGVGVETKTIEIDLSKQSYKNGQAVESLSVEPITIKFDKGTNSNAPKYYTSGNAVRCYGGNSFTISGATIQEVKITFGSDDKENEISSDKGNYKDGTWTGSESEVKFTIGGTSGHRRIAKLAITYIE